MHTNITGNVTKRNLMTSLTTRYEKLLDTITLYQNMIDIEEEKVRACLKEIHELDPFHYLLN